jgi:hypothetical protein
MPSNKEQETTEAAAIPTEPEKARKLAESIDELQAEVESLELQIKAIGRKSSGIISLVFAVPGALSLALSILVTSQVLAFIGLGLTFWGAIFFLVRPVTYVRGSLLSLTSISLYSTIDRIIKDLNCKGKALYVPPYSKKVYLPEHLKGLKDTIVFISVDENSGLPSIEEIARSKFMTKNPKGICLIPPGSGFLDQIEKTLRTDITKMSLEDLCETLPQLIRENFQLAKEIEMKTENNQVTLKTTNSIYKDLYMEQDLKTVRLIGCPLASAVASAIAKTTGKPVSLQSVNTSPGAETVEVSYALREG